MEYISAVMAATRWGITGRMINYYCAQGRIPGAQKIGGTWIIPENALKPADKRRRPDKILKESPDERKKDC